jgi:hypothetical protein
MREISLTYFGSVDESGTLKIRDRKGFDGYLKQFAGKEVSIDVKRKRSKRSDDQNRFFHSWVSLIAEHTGYSKDEMKDILKYKFLRIEEISDMTGETFVYTKNTSKLGKSEFADFCTEIQSWSMEMFKIKLPLPGEQWELTIL